MAENKTRPTTAAVSGFLKKIEDPQLRKDSTTIISMLQSITKLEPVLWGSAIIGFGSYHYVYESGREGDIMIVGFSPRKGKIALYLKGGLDPVKKELAELGRFKTGKGCLYVRSLDDVNIAVLKKMLTKVYRNA